VADAVWKAIVRNRGDVDVVPIQLKARLKMMAVAPGMFATIARSTGATRPNDELGNASGTNARLATIMSRAENVSVPSPASSR
jgi:hypothetical protein